MSVTVVRIDMPQRVLYIKGAEVITDEVKSQIIIKDNEGKDIAVFFIENIFGYHIFKTSVEDFNGLEKRTRYLQINT